MRIKKIKSFTYASILFLASASSCANQNSPPISPSDSKDAGIFSRQTASPPLAAVETAANQMVSSYRLGGAIKVQGIREIPNQNAAIADLRFDDFQYATDNEGGRLIEAAKYKPAPDLSKRNPTDPLPSMDEMFPPRKQTFNGQGTATLTKYNDGRWVLKEVRWGGGFNVFTVTGTTEVQ